MGRHWQGGKTAPGPRQVGSFAFGVMVRVKTSVLNLR